MRFAQVFSLLFFGVAAVSALPVANPSRSNAVSAPEEQPLAARGKDKLAKTKEKDSINKGITPHPDHGKTTLTSGVTTYVQPKYKGETSRGAMTDWMEPEKERGIRIKPAGTS